MINDSKKETFLCQTMIKKVKIKKTKRNCSQEGVVWKQMLAEVQKKNCVEIFPTPTLLQENNSLSLIRLKACLLANYSVTQSCRTHFSLSNQYFEFQHNAVISVSTRDFNSFQWTYFIIFYGKGWVLSELFSICRVTSTVKYILC